MNSVQFSLFLRKKNNGNNNNFQNNGKHVCGVLCVFDRLTPFIIWNRFSGKTSW